jgi:hypothetical protein
VISEIDFLPTGEISILLKTGSMNREYAYLGIGGCLNTDLNSTWITASYEDGCIETFRYIGPWTEFVNFCNVTKISTNQSDVYSTSVVGEIHDFIDFDIGYGGNFPANFDFNQLGGLYRIEVYKENFNIVFPKRQLYVTSYSVISGSSASDYEMDTAVTHQFYNSTSGISVFSS